MGIIQPATIINRQFDSFEEFSVLATSWNADFRQLDAEHFKSTMFQAVLGPMLISSARFGCHVDQYGATPAGMRTFAIANVDSPEMCWYGQKVGSKYIVSFPADGDIDVFSKPGFGAFTFSFPSELLMTFFEQNGVPLLGEMLDHSNKAWQATDTQLNRIRFLLNLVVTDRQGNCGHYLVEEIKELLLSILLQNIDSNLPKAGISGSKKYQKFKQVVDYINSSDQPILRISELCDASQISIRNIQYLFKQEIGMTPKRFLNGRRLYGVHRDLWQSDPYVTNVSDIANKWDFWHMGQFAADYKKIFGELPSDTLNFKLTPCKTPSSERGFTFA